MERMVTPRACLNFAYCCCTLWWWCTGVCQRQLWRMQREAAAASAASDDTEVIDLDQSDSLPDPDDVVGQ